MGPQFKVSFERLGELGNKLCTAGYNWSGISTLLVSPLCAKIQTVSVDITKCELLFKVGIV